MTETVNLIEHGDPSEPLQLDPNDVDRIEQENEKEEEKRNRGLKKLELARQKDGRFKLKAKGHVGSISLPSSDCIINIEPKFENAWDNLFKLFDYAEGIDASYGTSDVHAEAGDTLWDDPFFADFDYRFARDIRALEDLNSFDDLRIWDVVVESDVPGSVVSLEFDIINKKLEWISD